MIYCICVSDFFVLIGINYDLPIYRLRKKIILKKVNPLNVFNQFNTK